MSAPVAYGAAISEDRQHASVVSASRSGAGRVLVDLVFYDHPRLVVARMAELSAERDPVAVIVNPKSQSGTLIKPLADAGVWVTESSAPDIAVAHGTFLDLVADGQLELRDLESTNGTYVNGVRIGQPLILMSGDRLQVGSIELVAVRDEEE